jgi:hypothetical protein
METAEQCLTRAIATAPKRGSNSTHVTDARLRRIERAWLSERRGWIAAEAAVVAILALLRAAPDKESRHDEDRPGRGEPDNL